MKNLFEKSSADEIIKRVEQLQPAAKNQWGKMTAAQMLAHCAGALEMASGKRNFPRIFLGRIFGLLAKRNFLIEKPLSKNSPTDKNLIITDKRDFNHEKEKILKLVTQFSEGGPEKCTQHPHSFFGKLSPEEWSILQYKHLDHHFTQFGV